MLELKLHENTKNNSWISETNVSQQEKRRDVK
jgi:hypothetical protein